MVDSIQTGTQRAAAKMANNNIAAREKLTFVERSDFLIIR